MGRPPCCDKVGVKKGPWTPEEDIMLVTYVQEHGPGNWRAVPNHTGLKRCSKSCRLRWTNYLRPGIKRGSFTDHEEKMIIQLQALLGNKWAAIASYLPERTDNDIKNYWNTHLKKKLKKLQNGSGTDQPNLDVGFSSSHSISRGQWERRLQADIHTAKQALHDALSMDHQETASPTSHLPDPDPSSINGFSSLMKPPQTFSYASSTENIARLLKQWVKNAPKSEESSKSSSTHENSSSSGFDQENPTRSNESKSGLDQDLSFDSLFGFESFESSNSEDFSRSASPSFVQAETKPDPNNGLAPFSVLENWLLDDQGKDIMVDFSFDENPTDLFN